MGWTYPSGREVDDGGVVARILARVETCADEPRLMGVEKEEVPADVGSAGGG